MTMIMILIMILNIRMIDVLLLVLLWVLNSVVPTYVVILIRQYGYNFDVVSMVISIQYRYAIDIVSIQYGYRVHIVSKQDRHSIDIVSIYSIVLSKSCFCTNEHLGRDAQLWIPQVCFFQQALSDFSIPWLDLTLLKQTYDPNVVIWTFWSLSGASCRSDRSQDKTPSGYEPRTRL